MLRRIANVLVDSGDLADDAGEAAGISAGGIVSLGRALLECTARRLLLVLANVQNAALQLHHRVYGGAFLFGKSVMVVDHAVAAREIPQPSLRGNRFMGVDLVSNDPGVFVTNAGPISTGQPTRRLIREYIDH